MNRTTRYMLSLWLLAPAAAAFADESPAPAQPLRPTHVLNFALLIADNEPAKEGDDLAPPVAKAIADVKEFLPFKHYRLYDSALVRASERSPGHVELSGYGRSYYVDFTCQVERGGSRIEFQRFEMFRRPRAGGAPPSPALPQAQEKPPEPPPSDRMIISTSFSIVPGETIVVGTSTIIDQSAGLIIVLTALPER